MSKSNLDNEPSSSATMIVLAHRLETVKRKCVLSVVRNCDAFTLQIGFNYEEQVLVSNAAPFYYFFLWVCYRHLSIGSRVFKPNKYMSCVASRHRGHESDDTSMVRTIFPPRFQGKLTSGLSTGSV